MLVLTRKPMQSIVIGHDIRITIVKVERNQIRIGIEAPRDVTILRDELMEHELPGDQTEEWMMRLDVVEA